MSFVSRGGEKQVSGPKQVRRPALSLRSIIKVIADIGDAIGNNVEKGPIVSAVSSLWLPEETKIETEQEEDEMDDGAATADLRCFDKTCPQQRHRNIGEIEIE
jgi:hypothetical protein